MITFTETPRLRLRELMPADAAALFEMDSDAEVHQYLGGDPVTSLEQVQNAIEFIRSQYERHGIGRWAVVERSTGNVIGWAGLKYMTDEVNGMSEHYDLGYRFRKDAWGKGYATEAADAVLKYGFDALKLQHIYAFTEKGNDRSMRVLEKCGMVRDKEFIYDGLPHVWFSIFRGRFRPMVFTS